MNARTYPRTMNGINGAFRDATYATACAGLQRALLHKVKPKGCVVIPLCAPAWLRWIRKLFGR